jgi:hypothetical protein
MASGVGFVPLRLAGRIAELRECLTALQGDAALTDSCRHLILALGYDRRLVARHP